MSIRECGICSRYFHNPEGFYRCWVCTKKNREWKMYKGDEVLDAQLTEFDRIYRENMQKPIPVAKKVLRLDDLAQKRIKQLLLLCHPDKHGGTNSNAEEITQWLLKLRRT